MAFGVIGIIAKKTELAGGRPEAVGFITEDLGEPSTGVVSNVTHGLGGAPWGKKLHSHLSGWGAVTSSQMSTAHTVSFVMMEGCETPSAVLCLATQRPGPFEPGDGLWAPSSSWSRG